MRTAWTALHLTLLLAWGCAPADQTGEDDMGEMEGQEAEMAAADVSAAMDQLRMDWASAANADDAATVAAMYHPDAVFVDFYGQEHQGRDAIEAYLEETFAMASDLSVNQTWSAVVGHVQVTTGTWSQTIMGPDGDMPMSGFYHVTAEMMDDGTARIVAHSSGVPQPAPEGM